MVLCFCHGCLNKGIKECNFNQKKKERERECNFSSTRPWSESKIYYDKKKIHATKNIFLKENMIIGQKPWNLCFVLSTLSWPSDKGIATVTSATWVQFTVKETIYNAWVFGFLDQKEKSFVLISWTWS